MLMINKSKITQILDVPSSIFPIAVSPGMIIESSSYKSLPTNAFVEFNTDMFYNKEHVYLFRNYALGDLLQLIPVARIFKKHYNVKKITIITTEDYMKKLTPIYKDLHFNTEYSIQPNNDSICFNLNGCLEKDHSLDNKEHSKHRVEIYLGLLGINKYDKADIDWKPWNFNKMVGASMVTDKKKIGIQIRGSGPVKTLPYGYVKRIAETLADKYTVVLLDGDPSKGFEGKNIINTCGKLNTYQVIATLMHLDCCITMDSGMLWMAHAASCPVLVLLGPTREEERVSLHPLYPEKAKSISIAEMIGCQACFETQKFCKRNISCMKDFNEDQLLETIKSKLIEIVGE